jgi:multidrug transporter EmrE-like cation transporter
MTLTHAAVDGLTRHFGIFTVRECPSAFGRRTALAKDPSPVKYIPLILFTVLTNAAAQIMLKKGMMMIGAVPLEAASAFATAFRVLLNPWVFLGLCMFVVSMASHLIVLSRVELSFAYPFLSLAYVVVAAYAYFVFKEDVNNFRIAGIALICIGTILISRS